MRRSISVLPIKCSSSSKDRFRFVSWIHAIAWCAHPQKGPTSRKLTFLLRPAYHLHTGHKYMLDTGHPRKMWRRFCMKLLQEKPSFKHSHYISFALSGSLEDFHSSKCLLNTNKSRTIDQGSSSHRELLDKELQAAHLQPFSINPSSSVPCS